MSDTAGGGRSAGGPSVAGPSNGASQSQALNHGPGSFAHNNADQLPGGQTKAQAAAPNLRAAFAETRDPMTKAQYSDLGKTEAQRRAETTTPKAKRDAFKATRRSHAPAAQHNLRPDLPYSAAVDRKAHFVAMRRTDIDAQRTPQHQPAPGAKTALQSKKQSFFQGRFQRAAQAPSKTRSR